MADYKALYRKWRPRDFDSVCGQDAITDILKYEVENSKLSHAYLFSGSRGTGKTTCAKILAKAVNCLSPRRGNPCNECESCRSIDAGIATDVIEMDAASNNGVDNVRDMKDEIAFTPALLKYRVYIIDEVHMMSPSAFNALLKTLEEPPTYVIFILATTEFHKLPTTIVSRCQRFDFRRIGSDVIISRLRQIAVEEGISLTDDGARVIARAARGGMRDAISLLELCAGGGGEVTAEAVFSAVGTGKRDGVYSLIGAILKKDYPTVYSTVAEVVSKSGDLSVFWQEIIDAYRDIMVVKSTAEAQRYLDLTELEYNSLRELAALFTPTQLSYHVSLLEGAMADMQRAFNSKRSIAEITLTRMCEARSSTSLEALALRVEELEREISRLRLGAPISVQAPTPTVTEPAPTPTAAERPVEKRAEPAAEPPRAYLGWSDVLSSVGELKPPLAVKLAGSSAKCTPAGGYTVRMNAFFANLLKNNEQDLLLLRGVIAEREGVSRESVKLVIEPIAASADSAGDELARNIGDNF
ncbi:MAG: DNA polymerase III subunit gamma/tau [Clostridia bacterium]|nr:DNA polymerase III subunit gamma/tau [Clostridia bacterium]